eukprot:Gb_34781 [translate_table: standard]
MNWCAQFSLGAAAHTHASWVHAPAKMDGQSELLGKSWWPTVIITGTGAEPANTITCQLPSHLFKALEFNSPKEINRDTSTKLLLTLCFLHISNELLSVPCVKKLVETLLAPCRCTAYDVSLNDDSWPTDMFNLVSGNKSALWDKLDAGASASHSFVLDSNVKGLFYGAPAVVKYRVAAKSVLQEAYSTPIQPLDILAERAPEKRFEWKLVAKYGPLTSVLSVIGLFVYMLQQTKNCTFSCLSTASSSSLLQNINFDWNPAVTIKFFLVWVLMLVIL